jgi:hypothetical protein
VRRMEGAPPGTTVGVGGTGAGGAAGTAGSGADGAATRLLSTGDSWSGVDTAADACIAGSSSAACAKASDGEVGSDDVVASGATKTSASAGDTAGAVGAGLFCGAVSTTSAGDATDFFFRRPRRRTPAIPPCPEGPPP